MDKNAIKKFAVDARVMLMEAVAQRAYEYGITEEKIVDDVSGIGTRPLTRDEANQRGELIRQIRAKGYTQVMEEVAYTWFNRFIALRFMEVNGYLPSRVRVFTNENGEFKPEILKEALNVEIDGLDRDYILELLDRQENETLFKYLIIKQCNELSQSLPGMFEHLANYTELLFPNILLKSDSVIGRMISDIPEEDWKDEVQIIGWLYQYYSSEKKDEVFAALKKNVKITKENIPAATQLFTPDWIVRYMVENSLGRLWMDGHPDFEKSEWKYYLDEAEQTPEVAENLAKLRENAAKLQPEKIRFIDPSMGSGHVLVYAFDVLMQIYLDCGYTVRDAAQLIVSKNLYGLDIDKRAYQLAYFAVMMKARQYDRRFFTRGIQPNLSHFQDLPHADSHMLGEPLQSFVAQFENADTYGSLLTVRADADLDAAVDAFEGMIGFDHAQMEHLMTLYRILSQKYDVVCTNPPYMGGSGMNGTLSDFVKKHYPDSKSDLFAVFMERCGQLTKNDGYFAMITQHAWMFLSSYEKLRKKLLTHTTSNMAHLGARAFEEIGGEVVQTTAFVMTNRSIDGYKGTYCRLIEPTTQQGKEDMFLSGENRFESSQSNFSKIPGSPVAYWVSRAILNLFINSIVKRWGTPRQGLASGDNNRFLRLWHEVDYLKVGLNMKGESDLDANGKVYAPHNKGGQYRKWYGNLDYIICFSPKNRGLLAELGNHLPSRTFYFKTGFTWTDLTSGNFGARYINCGSVFDTTGPTFFCNKNAHRRLMYILGYFNSVVFNCIAKIFCSGMHYSNGTIAELPCAISEKYEIVVSNLVEENIALSKEDWDSFETSWDFRKHPLI